MNNKEKLERLETMFKIAEYKRESHKNTPKNEHPFQTVMNHDIKAEKGRKLIDKLLEYIINK